MTKPNRVWLELEVDSSNDLNDRRAALATTMLRKLGDPISKFWWNADKRRYCITTEEYGGFYECKDNGHWFNLDFMGKEVPHEPGRPYPAVH